ncbi:MAG: hypothetical protein WCI18_11450 [Pseudomonadota bacterium]
MKLTHNQKIRFVILGVLTSSFFGCSKESDDSSSSDAVTKGSYTITGPFCDDQKREPTFGVSDQAAQFRKFTDLTERTVTIGDALVEVQKDADCKLTITTGIKSNADGKLGLSLKTTYAFEPADCTLTVTTLSGTAEVGKATLGIKSTALFQDVTLDTTGATLTISGAPATGYTSKIPELTATTTGCGADESLSTLRYIWTEKK